MQLVQQIFAKDCGPACLSMLTDIPQETVLKYFSDDIDFNTTGLYWQSCEDFLSDNGFAVATKRRYFQRFKIGGQTERDPWPPKPWSSKHLCQVQQPSGNLHFVVMDENGTVFDPLGLTTNLGNYPEVQVVAAVVSQRLENQLGDALNQMSLILAAIDSNEDESTSDWELIDKRWFGWAVEKINGLKSRLDDLENYVR